MAGKLRVTQTKSTISHIARNRATVRALGATNVLAVDREAFQAMFTTLPPLRSVFEQLVAAPLTLAGKTIDALARAGELRDFKIRGQWRRPLPSPSARGKGRIVEGRRQ